MWAILWHLNRRDRPIRKKGELYWQSCLTYYGCRTWKNILFYWQSHLTVCPFFALAARTTRPYPTRWCGQCPAWACNPPFHGPPPTSRAPVRLCHAVLNLRFTYPGCHSPSNKWKLGSIRRTLSRAAQPPATPLPGIVITRVNIVLTFVSRVREPHYYKRKSV